MASRALGALVLGAHLLAAASPADWVPMRWPWGDAASLELLAGTPVNCLLVKKPQPAFLEAARARGTAVLAVVRSAEEAVAGVDGLVVEGEAPPGLKELVIELGRRSRMRFDGEAPVIGTHQGVWAGIQVTPEGAAKAGPTGSPWIDTNSGFIRAARALSPKPVWLANTPPAKTVIPAERYLQVICDAAAFGARWVVALDDDFAARLAAREPAALKGWRQMAQHLRFFEDHREWRAWPAHGRLALVQDPTSGALLSGGILDMIATKHTPVRPVPRQHLSPEALRGAAMAVNVDADVLTPEQRDVLRAFTRGGGTLLTGPPGWKDKSPPVGDDITLSKEELERLDHIWRDVQSMIGRRNLGARLFNVSSMLSNLQASPDGKQLLVQLINYSNYAVENVTLHVLGSYQQARLLTPEGEKDLEVYKTEEGTGVDVPRVSVCAAVRLD